ncbi:MAG TPA: GGDEF domain-containing protein [Planctomicrobium sp.]|nr:GGDEF domain-containing protein [Planctomicrobium sp.]
MEIGIVFGFLLLTGLAATNVLQFAIWLRTSKRRKQLLKEWRQKETAQKSDLNQLSQMVAARRFEIDWLLNTMNRPNRKRSSVLVRIKALLQQYTPTSEPLLVAATDSHGESITDSSTIIPSLTETGRQELSTTSPVLLDIGQGHFDRTVDERFQHCWAIPCESNGDSGAWLLCSHIPNLTGSPIADLSLLSKLCQSLVLPYGDPPAIIPATVQVQNNQQTSTLGRSEQDEIRLVRDMLQLRTLSDEEFNTPHEMLREFLGKLAVLTGFERASLHQQRKSSTGLSEQISCGGNPIPAGLMNHWNQAEQQLLSQITVEKNIKWLDSAELKVACSDGSLLSESGLQSVLLVRLDERCFTGGILLLTSRQSCQKHPIVDELVRWAAEYLPVSFEKALGRQVVEERARRDGLTRLANRQTFDQELEKQWQSCRVLESTCSLLLIDVDHFKGINDRFGHLAGDDVLRQVAQVISQTVLQQRVTDRPLVARYGGEEFAVILPACPLQGGARIAEEIRHKLASTTFQADGQTLEVTASIGVAASDADQKTSAELVRKADKVLYEAKHAGRNQVVKAEVCTETVSITANR